MEPTLIVMNKAGRFLGVHTVRKGDRYGLNGCLIHNEARPMIEFYDRTHRNRNGFGPEGQIIAAYYAATLLGHPGGGLCLWGEIEIEGSAWGQVTALAATLLEKSS